MCIRPSALQGQTGAGLIFSQPCTNATRRVAEAGPEAAVEIGKIVEAAFIGDLADA